VARQRRSRAEEARRFERAVAPSRHALFTTLIATPGDFALADVAFAPCSTRPPSRRRDCADAALVSAFTALRRFARFPRSPDAAAVCRGTLICHTVPALQYCLRLLPNGRFDVVTRFVSAFQTPIVKIFPSEQHAVFFRYLLCLIILATHQAFLSLHVVSARGFQRLRQALAFDSASGAAAFFVLR